MNENRYTRTVDSIKAPEKAVDKMLETVRTHEKKEKIIHMSTIRKTVIAASLAIAIAIGAVFGISAISPKDNPFTISVNAAEITDQKPTTIGSLNTIGGNWDAEQKTGEVAMTEFFEFNIKVDGSDIDNVLYTIGGGSFGVSTEDYGYSKMMYQSDVIGSEIEDLGFKGFTCLWLRADSADTTLPEEVRQAVRDWYDHANAKLGESFLQPDYDDSSFDIDSCAKTVYSALLDRLSVDVTVTYTDGKTENKTLVFSCESVGNGTGSVTISAKLQ